MTMKKILAGAAALLGTAVSAQAADMAVKAPYLKAPVAMVYDWTGFYVGVNAGGAFRGSNTNGFNNAVFFGGAAPFGGFVANNNGGNSARFIGGGQAGVNWQINQFVLGVEGDGQALVGGNNNNNNNNFGGSGSNGNNVGFLGTVRGRAGIALDRFLVYGTGGVAFGSNSWPNTILGTVGGVPTFFTANNRNNLRVGYAAGAGVEYAFTPNWSVKVEYLFTDLGRNNRTFLAPGGVAGLTFNNREQNHIVRAGVNYRFGWLPPAPVLARY
jgi:outer membrane immunogenic protein